MQCNRRQQCNIWQWLVWERRVNMEQDRQQNAFKQRNRSTTRDIHNCTAHQSFSVVVNLVTRALNNNPERS
jgi:hypothetical protein